MNVVFLQDVSNVARAGDIKEVKDGYARNYLIPKRLAAPTTHNELRRVEKLKKTAQELRLKESREWREVAEALDGTSITIKMRAGTGGQLYGSVTNAIISDEILKNTERTIDRRKIEIKEPIRQLGTYEVPVHLYEDIAATVTVTVEAE